MLHVVVFVACRGDVDFQFNKSGLSVLEKYVKNLVEKEVKAQMKELKNAQKIQDEAILALQSQIRSERLYHKELETRLKVLEGQRDCSQRSGAKTVENDREVKATVLGESKTESALVTSENNTHQTRDVNGKASTVKRLVTGNYSKCKLYLYKDNIQIKLIINLLCVFRLFSIIFYIYLYL